MMSRIRSWVTTASEIGRRCTRAAREARVPLLLILLLSAFMLLPPQTAEILRAFAEDPISRQWPRLLGWLLLGVLLIAGCWYSIAYAFRKNRREGDWVHRGLISVIVLAGPIFANAFAFLSVGEWPFSIALIVFGIVVGAIALVAFGPAFKKDNPRHSSGRPLLVLGFLIIFCMFAINVASELYSFSAPVVLTARLALLIPLVTFVSVLVKAKIKYALLAAGVLWLFIFEFGDLNDHHM